jgi:hypothetical protein
VGDTGIFVESYPQLVASTLDLNKISTDDPDIDLDEVEALLSLFAFRNLVHTSLYRHVMQDSAALIGALGVFRALWEKALEIIQACPYQLRHPYHEEIRRLVEELVVWARDLVFAVGFPAFQRGAPDYVEWILDDVEGDRIYQYLSEEGLQAAVDFIQTIRPPALEALLTLCLEPYYIEKPDTESMSTSISAEVISALDDLTGGDSLVYLQKTFERANRLEHRRTLIRAIGKWARSQNRERKRDALGFIKSILLDPDCDRALKLACIRAIGDGKLYGMVRWLLKGYENAFDEELREEYLISLIVLIGESAAPLAMEFIQDASSGSRQYVASVAWRIDRDDLYDALLQLEPDNDELNIIVMISLARTHNPRANRLAISGLASSSRRLQEGAAVVAGDCFEHCHPSRLERETLIQGLAALAHGEDQVLRNYAISSLLRSGDETFGEQGVKAVKDLILKGEYLDARVLIYHGGTHLPGWPGYADGIDWLQSASPQIRHMSAYILGHQRRAEFLDPLTWLQNDIRSVPRFASGPKSRQIMGQTVAQAAALAMRRIRGEIPPQLVPWFMDE